MRIRLRKINLKLAAARNVIRVVIVFAARCLRKRGIEGRNYVFPSYTSVGRMPCDETTWCEINTSSFQTLTVIGGQRILLHTILAEIDPPSLKSPTSIVFARASAVRAIQRCTIITDRKSTAGGSKCKFVLSKKVCHEVSFCESFSWSFSENHSPVWSYTDVSGKHDRMQLKFRPKVTHPFTLWILPLVRIVSLSYKSQRQQFSYH